MYAVVRFSETDNIEVVPTSWLTSDENQSRWPVRKSSMFTTRCIRQCKEPEEDWEVYDLKKVYSFHRSFKGANERAECVLDTSTFESGSSSSEEELIRKRKKPSRYCSDNEEKSKRKVFTSPNDTPISTFGRSASTSDEEVAKYHALKKFCPPPLPMLKVLTHSQGEIVGSSSQSPQSESLISPKPACIQGSLVSPRIGLSSSVNKQMWEQVLTVLVEMRKDIKEVKENQIKILSLQSNGSASSVLIELPEGIEFPIYSDEVLIQLDNKLKKDINLQCLLIRYFETVSSGKSAYAFLLNLCRRLITVELAMTYSRLGRKGKKCFENLTAVTNTILAAALKRFKEVSRQELSEKFGKVLATAYEWDGRKPKIASANPESLLLETMDCIEEYNKL